MKSNKIVVSSIGVCHKYGLSLAKFEKELDQLDQIDDTSLMIEDAILEKELLPLVKKNKLRRIDRASKISLTASLKCSQELNIDITDHIEEVGVIISTTYGALASSRNFIKKALEHGPTKASPIIFPFSVPNAAAGITTIELGVRGFNTTISGCNPIGYAYELLKLGRASAIFAGGFEELTTELVDSNKLRPTNVNDTLVSSQKDLLAEGSAMTFVTSQTFAEEHDLPILFEILGYATRCNIHSDNNKIDNFGSISSSIVSQMMLDVLTKSEIDKGVIKLIVSLSGSRDNQRESEQVAIEKIWGQEAPRVYYSKEKIGEVFGASDTFNTILGYSQLKTISDTERYAIINNYQVGGTLSSMIIKIK